MMQNKLGYIILIVVSTITIYYNYKVFDANIDQVNQQHYISQGAYDLSPQEINRLSTNYPSLNNTAIPFKSFLGAYYITNDSIEKGIKFLEEGEKENPFLGYEDMLRAKLYETFGAKDSFEFYARKAVKKLPNVAAHFVLIARLYVMERKIDSLEILFNSIAKKDLGDSEVWKVYLTAMATNKKYVDSAKVFENALYAKSLFPRNEQIKLSGDYVLYGIDNVKKSIELRDEAIDQFSSSPLKSIEYMQEALTLVPDDMANYQTLIEMLFVQEKYREVIDLYVKLNTLNLTTLRLDSIEYIGLSYLNLNETSRGCNLLSFLEPYNYEISDQVRLLCNISN